MLRLDSKAAAADLEAAERIDVFAIDDTTYTIPKEIDASALLRFLDDSAQVGENAAMANLMRELISDDGYEALLNFKGLKPKQLKELLDSVEEYAMGQMDDLGLGGKSRRRSSRR